MPIPPKAMEESGEFANRGLLKPPPSIPTRKRPSKTGGISAWDN